MVYCFLALLQQLIVCGCAIPPVAGDCRAKTPNNLATL
jgi:hypothetical protein